MKNFQLEPKDSSQSDCVTLNMHLCSAMRNKWEPPQDPNNEKKLGVMQVNNSLPPINVFICKGNHYSHI